MHRTQIDYDRQRWLRELEELANQTFPYKFHFSYRFKSRRGFRCTIQFKARVIITLNFGPQLCSNYSLLQKRLEWPERFIMIKWIQSVLFNFYSSHRQQYKLTRFGLLVEINCVKTISMRSQSNLSYSHIQLRQIYY